jgi:hypothetical protein
MNPCDGTCEHYGRIEYQRRACVKCWMWFLACPICMPTCCPDCRVEIKIVKLDESYYKARRKERDRVRAWKQRHKERAGVSA